MPRLMKSRRLTDVLSWGLRSSGLLSRLLAMASLPDLNRAHHLMT
jgi:hypothetical protein